VGHLRLQDLLRRQPDLHQTLELYQEVRRCCIWIVTITYLDSNNRNYTTSGQSFRPNPHTYAVVVVDAVVVAVVDAAVAVAVVTSV
jgi:hypothetical protein